MSGADAAANFAPLDAPAFVAPKHLLSRPTVSPADKEQIEGLVSLTYLMRCAGADRVIADHSRIFEGEDKLRRAAHQLPPDRPGYRAAGEEEPQHPQPEWWAQPDALTDMC